MQAIRIKSIALALLSVIGVFGLFGAAGAGARVRSASSRHTVLSLEQTKYGKVLVANGDEVLFVFTKGNSIATCTGACASIWPPFEASRLVAGSGVNAKMLHTVARGNSRQVTYDGHLLYLYADGKASYDIAYIGIAQFGGTWKAITASGKSVG